MKNVRLSLIAVACIATSSLGLAAAADEHAAHHPDAASAPATGASTAKAKAAKAKAVPKAVTVSPMDQQMQAMQAMHDKMMNAKTMDERRGMLDEQMKSMESGMAMMDQMGMGGQPATPAASSASAPGGMGMGGGMGMAMGSGGMPAQHASMMKRMEMMQMMMRMMMDRLSVEPAK
jgi:hypothetical protein